ncbi:MAG: hypothetical protein ACFFG0_00645 [Candidatus Thorarchaeota archaeon]
MGSNPICPSNERKKFQTLKNELKKLPMRVRGTGKCSSPCFSINKWKQKCIIVIDNIKSCPCETCIINSMCTTACRKVAKLFGMEESE